ncbi:MAG: hypothetical protein A2095_01000 [Sphingomonadales bacterium GWF1_63_6]|nr:MAG: hypothetical protein A2095_01000 [Sphingomonadales bacterium GWF1_63_6]
MILLIGTRIGAVLSRIILRRNGAYIRTIFDIFLWLSTAGPGVRIVFIGDDVAHRPTSGHVFVLAGTGVEPIFITWHVVSPMRFWLFCRDG